MSKTVNFEKKELKTVVKFKKQTSGETNFSSKSSYHTFQCKGVINDLPDVICDIAIYADDATLNFKRDQASDRWQQLELAFGLESHMRDTVGLGKKWFVDFLVGKPHLAVFDWSNNIGSIDAKMDGSVLVEKSSFKMLDLTFSSKLDWGSYIISITKAVSQKIGTLIRSIKFLSPGVALYLYKSTIC